MRSTLPRTVLALLLSAAPAVSAQSDRPSTAKPAEYMIYQYPAVSLVVVIDARETEFEASIKGPEGAPVSETAVAARRIGPVYQFVEAVDTPRQLMIAVNPAQAIERSRISMELLQLPETDRNTRALASAYRLLALGMQRVRTDSTSTWAQRAYSLQNAAQAFAAMGMEEMRLWAEYYASHLILHEIGDMLLALERSRAVGQAAGRAGFETIELAAAILEAESLMLAGESSRGEQSYSRFEDAHRSWQRVAQMAGEQGYENERGRALYRDGIAYERQDRLDRAIERYEQALDITSGSADSDLLNAIRATAASAYETRGSASGAISLLEDIADDLAGGEATAEQKLARNLHEKGRLLNSTFRYPEAVTELEQALRLRKESPETGQWGLTGLELGRARYALGYLETAESVILESLPRTPPAEKQALADAYGMLAAINREQGRHGKAAEYRAQQGQLIAEPERPAFLFESAVDALERDGPGSAEAVRLIGEARNRSVGTDLLTEHRSALYRCLVRLQARGAGACNPESARKSQDILRRSGIPRVEVDSGLVWTIVLRLSGREPEARERVAGLMDSVQFYRERLPGVIASWYGSHREELFRQSVDLARGSSAEDLLLALDRVRALERVTTTRISPEEGVRNIVARVVAAQPAPGEALSRQVHGELEAFREQSGWSSQALERRELRGGLDALSRGTSLLAYHFSGSRIFAVSATRNGVEVTRLTGVEEIRRRIDSARAALRNANAATPDGDLEALGKLLLEPLANRPGELLYLLPSGPLNGFPFDALRVDGRYLARRTRVVNVDSLAALGSARPALPADYAERVFLAGNPRSGRDLFSYGVSTSDEIGAVRDHFVGGGLHIVQGVALRGDEFEDDRYRVAALAHLAMPGRVDLAHPERSRLLLSGERESPEAEFLSPAQLRELGTGADLAVLSGTSFAGRARTGFGSRLGLVHDLQDAGARSVVAALWPAGDAETAAFMSDFYRVLEKERDVAEALFRTRQSRIASKSDTNIRLWAGFQLFIR